MKYPEGGTVVKHKKENGITYTIREEDYYKPSIIEAYCDYCEEWKKKEEFVKNTKKKSRRIFSNSICKDCNQKEFIQEDSDEEYEKLPSALISKEDDDEAFDLYMKQCQIEFEERQNLKEKIWCKRYGKKSKICKCAVCYSIIKYNDCYGIAFKTDYGEKSHKSSSYDIVCLNCESFLESSEMSIEKYTDFMSNQFSVIKMDEEVKGI